MFARIAIAALAISVLGAGAFAFSPSKSFILDLRAPANTVIAKNQAWPIAGFITVDPCAARACEDI